MNSEKPVKVLFVAASPADEKLIASPQEFTVIRDELHNSPSRGRAEVVYLPAASSDDLEKALYAHDPFIVHFSGHGTEEAELLFQQFWGEREAVGLERLKAIFGMGWKSLRVVILNACHTLRQADVIATQRDCVIAMRGKIANAVSVEFAQRFYRALGYDRSVQQAFKDAIGKMPRDQVQLMPRQVGEEPSALFLFPPGEGAGGSTSAPGGGRQSAADKPLGRETPLRITLKDSVEIYTQEGDTVKLKWDFPVEAFRDLGPASNWDHELWTEIATLLRRLYVLARDIHVGLVLYMMDKDEQHLAHTQAILRSKDVPYRKLRHRLNLLTTGQRERPEVRMLLQVNQCFELLSRSVTMEKKDVPQTILFATRICHWLADAHLQARRNADDLMRNLP